MIKELKNAPENVAAFKCTGKLTPDDYKIVNSVMEEHKRKYGKIRLFMEVTNLGWPSVEAIWEDLKTDLRFFTDVSKVAMITDKKWIDRSTRFGVFFTPIHYRSFEPGQHEKAYEWLNVRMPESKVWIPALIGAVAFVGTVAYFIRKRSR